MNKKILLTSFQTWLPHQKSNASDDLLEIIAQNNCFNYKMQFIRQLPVNIPQAAKPVIQHLKKHQPDIVICSGMAEKRTMLTIESNATWKKQKINTLVKLEEIVSQLTYTDISHNAGKFVCEGLYYRVLSYLGKHHPQSKSIFLHVPILNQNNLPLILEDIKTLIKSL
jgi:pyroglutamyl-peptidase